MQAVRILGAVLGGMLILGISRSLIRILVVPRLQRGARSMTAPVVEAVYRVLVRRCRTYEHRDGILATKAAALLLTQLAGWLAGYLVGFALLTWPLLGDLGMSFESAGSSMFTLGYLAPRNAGENVITVIAAAVGLIVVALQIAYLPTLYGAFNRRETLVALLYSRAGLPPWGPELLARTRYGINGDRDDLPAFYAAWEQWAADVAESHSNYTVLVQFRSPQPYSSWLVALLAVMDSAAMLLAVAPSRDRIEPRLCLRMGFTALRQIADAMAVPYDTDPDSTTPLQLDFQDFHAGYRRLLDVGFGVERTAEEAWPHFRGWRANYESIAYQLGYAIDAVPALWSGPRRFDTAPMPPKRPPNRRPGEPAPLKPS